MLRKIPEHLKGSYSAWLASKAARAKQLAPGALPAGYEADRAGRRLRQELERELRVVLTKLEQFSNSASIAASRGEEFAPLLGELIGNLQAIQAEQQKARPRRLVDMVREKMAAGQNQDDFTRQLAAVRARPVTRKRGKSLAGLVVKHAGVEELNDIIKTLRAV